MVAKDKLNETLKQFADSLADLPDKGDGHSNLLQDLGDLVIDATNYEFHDFKNEKYPAPKIALRGMLLKMAEGVVDGRYDN